MGRNMKTNMLPVDTSIQCIPETREVLPFSLLQISFIFLYAENLFGIRTNDYK